jgi:hypothetical protein
MVISHKYGRPDGRFDVLALIPKADDDRSSSHFDGERNTPVILTQY